MAKTVTLIVIGLLLVASQTYAGEGQTVAVADTPGMYVRVASPSAVHSGNAMGSAVNTGGVARATTAVKVGGRVYLTAGTGSAYQQTLAAAPTPRSEATNRPPTGLAGLVARFFGLSG